MKVLDQGYVTLIESWGSDERIIESARMSTAKGFLGWGPRCPNAPPGEEYEHDLYKASIEGMGGEYDGVACRKCQHAVTPKAGDEKLLQFLWDKKHATPFEMAGLTIEVKAPLMVFREWHRHRTQGYNEMSARYVALPDENYMPTLDRLVTGNAKSVATTNRQAQGNGKVLDHEDALAWLASLADLYDHSQAVYEKGIEIGVPKELARLPVTVGRYSAMRATANLRNWLGFLALRCAPDAQWEIVQFANVVASFVKECFPHVHEVSRTSLGLPE